MSVILPIFNVERYLPKCLESLLASTMHQIEIICVNDGSADNSIRVLEEYAGSDKRMVILNQENQGPGAARNFGLVHAKGECVHFCDPDDFIASNMYERLYTYMIDSNSDVVCSGTNFEYEVHSSRKIDDEEYYAVRYAGVQLSAPEMISTVDGVVWNKLFRRSFLMRHRIRFPMTRLYEDLVFRWFWMTSSPTIYFSQEKLYTYVRREGSFVSNVLSGRSLHHEDLLIFTESVYQHLEGRDLLGHYQVHFWRELYKSGSWLLGYLTPKQSEALSFKMSGLLRNMNFQCLNGIGSSKEFRFFRAFANGVMPHENDVERAEPQTHCSLSIFGIPIAGVRTKAGSMRIRVFGFIPFLTIKCTSNLLLK